MDDSGCIDEIEVLESIYLEDLKVIESDSNRILQMTLHPSTADNEEERFVCMTLELTISEKYPSQIPEIKVKNPRGISDAHIASILENANALAEQKSGEAMLFDLIEYAKSCLTNNNHPSCVCAICLEHFEDADEFTRTTCYHFFHSYCLNMYFISINEEEEKDAESGNITDQEVLCPVCRHRIVVDVGRLADRLPPIASGNEVLFVQTDDFLKWRKDMEVIYDRQKRAGGIIDVEAQRNRFLIGISNDTANQLSVQGTVESDKDTPEAAKVSSQDISSPSSEDKVSLRNIQRTRHAEKDEYQYPSVSRGKGRQQYFAESGTVTSGNFQEREFNRRPRWNSRKQFGQQYRHSTQDKKPFRRSGTERTQCNKQSFLKTSVERSAENLQVNAEGVASFNQENQFCNPIFHEGCGHKTYDSPAGNVNTMSQERVTFRSSPVNIKRPPGRGRGRFGVRGNSSKIGRGRQGFDVNHRGRFAVRHVQHERPSGNLNAFSRNEQLNDNFTDQNCSRTNKICHSESIPEVDKLNITDSFDS